MIPKPLRPDEVRWFYQKPDTYWIPFNGHDSLDLEKCYRQQGECLESKNPEDGTTDGAGLGGEEERKNEVIVLDDVYLANIELRTLEPVYWKSEYLWIL